VELIGRGAPYVRWLPGPAGAPTVLLLHGLTGTADQTWAPSYRALNRHFPVVALDLRGHGGGIPLDGAFRLEDCVDDVAALIRTLGVGPVIAVGYSMGGAVAQLLWRHHPRLVQGLVLCSTAANFGVGPVERLAAAVTVAAAAALRTVPPLFRIGFDFATSIATRGMDDPERQWLNADYGRCSFDTFTSAAAALARFTSRDWVGDVDVPTAVIVTRQDRLIPPTRQRELAGFIPGTVVHEVDGGHGAFVTAPDRFLPVLLLACRTVGERRQASMRSLAEVGER
jgi:pimeloyl-ACP methyl ester carboxylesterase